MKNPARITCSFQCNTIPSALDRNGVLSEVAQCTFIWAKAIGIQTPWQRYAGMGASDIVFRFGSLAEYNQMLSGHVLGLTQSLEAGNTLITFSNADAWSLPASGWFAWISRIFQKGNDLRTCALHEIGHALGLDHNDEWDSVMNPAAEAGGLCQKPSDRDVARARAILFPAGGPSPS